MPLDWSPLWLSVRYAGLATLLSMLVALPLAWLLEHRNFPGCELVEAAASLPLVMPPAVLVYYLIARLGRWPLQFSWRAAVAVSAVYTLPLLLRMTRAGLAGVDPIFENAARVLGAGEWRTFRLVALPLAWRALWAAMLTGLVRALADFGATEVVARHAPAGWLLAIAAAALGALYTGNRLGHGQAPV